MEALARAAAEERVQLVSGHAGHAGRPVAAMLEAALREGVCARPAPNEKVALEVAMGASLAGARAVAAVASLAAVVDPLHAMAYVGAAGGFAVVAVDDPGLALCAVEADSRTLARALELPWIEPSDAPECKEYLAAALGLSERWETPVVVRITTRVALTGRPVSLGATAAGEAAGLRRGRERLVPGRRRRPRSGARERLAQLAAHAGESPLNRVELRSPALGVVTSGASYHHVREALPEASVLKLGLSFPFPAQLARDFAARVERLVVVEELEPVLEYELRALGISCQGESLMPRTGELGPDLIALALGSAVRRDRRREAVPERPPEPCAGCPRRALFHALKRVHVNVAGDLGCATMGASAPLATLESAFAVGASVGVAHGAELVLGERVRGRLVAVLDEGAFLHSGALALAHVAGAGAGGTVVVAEDGMRPGAGAPAADLASLARALVGGDSMGRSSPPPAELAGGGHPAPPQGATGEKGGAATSILPGLPRVREVDALDLAATEAALREELARPELSVVVARGRCPMARTTPRPPCAVNGVRCNRCGACLRLGCPAISDGFDAMVIDADTCAGCGLCVQVCRAGAIAPTEPSP
jgi:indolepyruvate ferredoxin oxidoreductase alpha subunit